MVRVETIIGAVQDSSGTLHAFERVVDLLLGAFDSEVAFLHVAAAYPLTGSGPIVSRGFDPQRLRACAPNWPLYHRELRPLMKHAQSSGSVVQESDVFSAEARARKAYFRQLTMPERGKDCMIAYLPWRGTFHAALMLGSRTHDYSRAARRQLDALVPSLALAVAAAPAASRHSPEGARLTARETQIVPLLERGLTNAEIGLCLGSSENTVRNQVAAILRKLECDSRVELVALGLSTFLSAASSDPEV